MRLEGLNIEVTQMPGAMQGFRAEVDAPRWVDTCRQVSEQGGRLVALWGSDAREEGSNEGRGFVMHAALAARAGLVVLVLPLTGESYPDVSTIFPAADRMQRAA